MRGCSKGGMGGVQYSVKPIYRLKKSMTAGVDGVACTVKGNKLEVCDRWLSGGDVLE